MFDSFRVVTLQFGDLEYFPYSSALNQHYCQRHGYPFCIHTTGPLSDRNPIWSKLKAIRQELELCDWLLFIDADAAFIDHERSLEHLLPYLNPQHLMLVGTDRKSDLIVWNDKLANTGVFLLRRDPATLAMLDEWWMIPTRDRSTAFQWPVEQLAFNRHILPKYREKIALVDYTVLGGMDTTFIRHPANESLSRKAEILRKDHERLAAKYGWQGIGHRI